MRIASGTVLGLATLAASPALWQSWTGALPLDVALTRYLVAVVVVWAALSVLVMLVGSPPRPTAPPGAATGHAGEAQTQPADQS
jgi:hypothetical protein